MLKRIFIVPIASALLVATVYAHEPGGFNGRLYGAEVAVGGAITLAPVIWGGPSKGIVPVRPGR